MKNYIAIFFCLFILNGVFGQDPYMGLKNGDLLLINKKTNVPFDHLYFPKPNFIIKRGGIVNYKNLDGWTVRIDEISENGRSKLAPLNKKRFFNLYVYVEANLVKALENKELVLLKKPKQQSLVQE